VDRRPERAPRWSFVLAALVSFCLALGLAPATSQADTAASVKKQLDTLTARIAAAEAADARLADSVAKLEKKVRADEARLKGLQGRLAARTRALYTGGMGTSTLEAMLTSDDPASVIERVTLVDAATRSDRTLLRESTTLRKRLDRTRTRVARERREHQRVAAELRADLERLQRLLVVADRPVERASRRSERASTSRSSAAAGRARMSGRYACPVGANHAFRDTWGAPRSGGRRHKGTDVFAPHGSPAYAVTDGVITRVGNSRLGGLGFYLRGGDGNEYFYTHMSSVSARAGERVEAGEVVARVGNTGNARGGAAHIHFELHPGGGSPINPYPLLARIC
jgi:peptidoglycan LD-endopeptidase LytH